MGIGLYGKHPAKGDFIAAGLSGALMQRLEVWLDGLLQEARSQLAGDWPGVWANAPQLRFWLGEGIWGQPVAGVMAASCDRVGRRFPLILLAEGAEVPPPPVIDTAQHWYDAAAAWLGDCLSRAELATGAALLESLPAGLTGSDSGAGAGPDFWALRDGPEVSGLWADVALADHRRAAAGRSYWWVEGEVAGLAEAPVAAAPETVPGEDALPDPDRSEDPDPSEEDLGSPFGAAESGLGLFASPEPADPQALADPAPTPPPAVVPTPSPRAAQVWAGAGLPSAAVMVWFFRGHAGSV